MRKTLLVSLFICDKTTSTAQHNAVSMPPKNWELGNVLNNQSSSRAGSFEITIFYYYE